MLTFEKIGSRCVSVFDTREFRALASVKKWQAQTEHLECMICLSGDGEAMVVYLRGNVLHKYLTQIYQTNTRLSNPGSSHFIVVVPPPV